MSQTSRGQELLSRKDGQSGDSWGSAFLALGDVNQDLFDDYAIGALYADLGGLNSGAVHVFSGSDHSLLFSIPGNSLFDELGFVSARGDVNGDGIQDLVLAGHTSGVTVYSGSDGTLLHQLGAGHVLGTAGDIDADGYEDFLLGRHGNEFGEPAVVQLISGQDAGVVHEVSHNGPVFSCALSGLPDLTSDGYGEYIAGICQQNETRFYSGASGQLLATLTGEALNDAFGTGLCRLADLNGDQIDDFAVGAPQHDAAASDAGRVYVYSSADLALLYCVDGAEANDRLGVRLANAGDVNGDGIADLLLGMENRSALAGRAQLHSGATGQLLYAFEGQNAGDRLGGAVGAAGDVDGDGLADLLLGAPGAALQGANSGSSFLHRGSDLFLLAEPKIALPGNLLRRTLREGVPGNLLLIAIVDVNSSPLFYIEGGLRTFDLTGSLVLDVVVPPGFGGFQLTYQAYALNALSAIVASGREVVLFP
jgi:hypothetical protein